MFGQATPNLQKIAIHILSQPSSAFGCERNWSMFEHIHSKRRNRFFMQSLNDLVFVHYNLHLRTRQILVANSSLIILQEIDPESEWLIEAMNPVFVEVDHVWVDQVDREVEAVAMQEERRRLEHVQALANAHMHAQSMPQTQALALFVHPSHMWGLWLIAPLGPTFNAFVEGIEDTQRLWMRLKPRLQPSLRMMMRMVMRLELKPCFFILFTTLQILIDICFMDFHLHTFMI